VSLDNLPFKLSDNKRFRDMDQDVDQETYLAAAAAATVAARRKARRCANPLRSLTMRTHASDAATRGATLLRFAHRYGTGATRNPA